MAGRRGGRHLLHVAEMFTLLSSNTLTATLCAGLIHGSCRLKHSYQRDARLEAVTAVTARVTVP